MDVNPGSIPGISVEFSEINSSSDRVFEKLGQVAYDDDWLLVLDERDNVIQEIPRARIESVKVEMRSSFKHPVIGVILGGILVGVPASAFLGDPLGVRETILYHLEYLLSAASLFFFGLFLLFPALASRKIPWLVIGTSYGERAFPLQCEITDEFTEFTTVACAVSPDILPD